MRTSANDATSTAAKATGYGSPGFAGSGDPLFDQNGRNYPIPVQKCPPVAFSVEGVSDIWGVRWRKDRTDAARADFSEISMLGVWYTSVLHIRQL